VFFLASREDGPAVGAEAHEPDLVLVSEGRADGLARSTIPEFARSGRSCPSSVNGHRGWMASALSDPL